MPNRECLERVEIEVHASDVLRRIRGLFLLVALCVRPNHFIAQPHAFPDAFQRTGRQMASVPQYLRKRGVIDSQLLGQRA
jgi:hypothetical protein